MRCQVLCVLLYASIAIAQGPQVIATATCPTSAPGPSSSLPGWDLSRFIYVVYSETPPSGSLVTTAHIEFDIVGAFSNQLFHCETTGPDILANYTGSSDSRWKSCKAKEADIASRYATSFRYEPGTWDTLTLGEMSLCGTDPQDKYDLLFVNCSTEAPVH